MVDVTVLKYGVCCDFMLWHVVHHLVMMRVTVLSYGWCYVLSCGGCYGVVVSVTKLNYGRYYDVKLCWALWLVLTVFMIRVKLWWVGGIMLSYGGCFSVKLCHVLWC